LLFESEVAGEPGPLEKYPAARTLVRIGSPIYPEIWGQLQEECSDRYLHVLAFTIIAIDGKTVAVARIGEQLIGDRVTAGQKANLERLLKLLQTTAFDDPRSWP
jgi:hypothetical protein